MIKQKSQQFNKSLVNAKNKHELIGWREIIWIFPFCMDTFCWSANLKEYSITAWLITHYYPQNKSLQDNFAWTWRISTKEKRRRTHSSRYSSFLLLPIEFPLNDFPWIHWFQWIMKSPKLEWLPGITTCLVIDVFSDEVVKMKFLLLFLDIYISIRCV